MEILIVDFRQNGDGGYHVGVAVVAGGAVKTLKYYVAISDENPYAELRRAKLGDLYNQQSHYSSNPVNDAITLAKRCPDCEIYALGQVPREFIDELPGISVVNQGEDHEPHPCDSVINYAMRYLGVRPGHPGLQGRDHFGGRMLRYGAHWYK